MLEHWIFEAFQNRQMFYFVLRLNYWNWRDLCSDEIDCRYFHLTRRIVRWPWLCLLLWLEHNRMLNDCWTEPLYNCTLFHWRHVVNYRHQAQNISHHSTNNHSFSTEEFFEMKLWNKIKPNWLLHYNRAYKEYYWLTLQIQYL